MAAPIFDASGHAIAALSVANVKMMLPGRVPVESLSAKVMEAADDFTASLGGRCPGLEAGGR